MSFDKCIHPWLTHYSQEHFSTTTNSLVPAAVRPASAHAAPGDHCFACCHYRLDFPGRISYRGSHAVSLLYHFVPSPAVNVSAGCFTLAPISLVRLIKFNPSHESLEVFLCGVALLCVRRREHAFVFKAFPLTWAFNDSISSGGRERQGASRQNASGCQFQVWDLSCYGWA